MTRLRRGFAGVALLVASWCAASGPSLTHRVWLLGPIPDEASLNTFRQAGVDGVVVPVGTVELSGGSSRFTLASLGDVKPLASWDVCAAVWVEAAGKDTGDAAVFASQLAPVQRMLPPGAHLLFAARKFAPGIPEFVQGVARKLRHPVELALPVQELVQYLPRRGWSGVSLVAFAFGNQAAIGMALTIPTDDLGALETLDATQQPYRVAIVVEPKVTPQPGATGASLAQIAGPEVSTYRPSERGDAFLLRRDIDWGGVHVAAGQTITVEAVDTVRYHRDLRWLLRPLRPALIGWDTVGLPPAEPALGMSREALLEYLQGGMPYPVPQVEVRPITGTAVRVTVTNPTAQASALSSVGNWAEVAFEGTEPLDAQLGDFAGIEYGKRVAGVWRRTAARDATSCRLFMTYLGPRARVASGLLSFISRPRDVRARWCLRLGDGSDVVGPWTASVTKP